MDVVENGIDDTIPECPLPEEGDPFLWAIGSLSFFGKSEKMV
jgi:hypothetical protein